jgi:hypothetical protein
VLELTQPEDRDQTQWCGNALVIYWPSKPERAFSNPGEKEKGTGQISNTNLETLGAIPRLDSPP